MTITPDDIHAFILLTCEGVVPKQSWGETAYFYNPGQILKNGTYFATVKKDDGPNDKASGLCRDGVWRLNLGLSRSTFTELFGDPPARPSKGKAIEGGWDFTKTDQLTPHPVYGWMCWIAGVNPSPRTFETCMPLIADAHAKAVAGFEKRTQRALR
jgi:hypothetical protein